MTFLETASIISIIIMSISLVIMLIRIGIGPTAEDRVVALDLITTTMIGIIAIYAVITGKKTLLDVGIIIGLLAFIGTVGFAYYLSRREKK